jgi:hypothetical protein
MNKQPEKNGKRRLRVPQWLREEWVLQCVLAILVLPVAVQAILSTGTSIA